MSVECKITKAVGFNCEKCELLHIIQPLKIKETDETGYVVFVDYIRCDNCGWLNRVVMQKREWEKLVK